MAQVLDHKEAKAEAKAAKAHAKALRPWFKKKRWWVAIATVALIGIMATSGGSKSDTQDASAGPSAKSDSGVRSSSSNTANPPEADVTVKSCAADEVGFMSAEVEIVNHSSKASNYMVEVAYEGNGGATQLGTGNAYVSGLEPGQSTVQDASSLTEATGAFTCRVTSVDRFAA